MESDKHGSIHHTKRGKGMMGQRNGSTTQSLERRVVSAHSQANGPQISHEYKLRGVQRQVSLPQITDEALVGELLPGHLAGKLQRKTAAAMLMHIFPEPVQHG